MPSRAATSGTARTRSRVSSRLEQNKSISADSLCTSQTPESAAPPAKRQATRAWHSLMKVSACSLTTRRSKLSRTASLRRRPRGRINIEQPPPHLALASQMALKPRPRPSNLLRRSKKPYVSRISLPEQCAQPVRPSVQIALALAQSVPELPYRHIEPPNEVRR